MSEILSTLKSRLQDYQTLGETAAVLEWDLQTQMPPGGAEARARHVGLVSRLAHQLFSDDETGELLEAAKRELVSASHESDDYNLVRVAQRDYDHAHKIPTAFVEEFTKLTTLAHAIWANARTENNFKAFAPTLQKIVDMTIQRAEYLGYSVHPYDALIDLFEPGMTAAQALLMFAELRQDLVPLVQQIVAKQETVSDSAVHQPFDEDKQREFAEMVVKTYGYDFQRGRQDRAVHPFCTSFSRNDVRITTRYDKEWLNPALFGTMHEAGHGMYEQGVGEQYEGNILSGGVSLGVHESQSRLWENVIGRSRGFWKRFYPDLQKLFPKQLGKVDLETFYRAINVVHPSFIRVEADEVTYNLHIMVRLELEVDLVARKLKVEDLPEAWNAKYKQYLGITPPTDAIGVLQDVHWSAGLIGYFTTYSMGNLLSVQLYDKAVEAHPSIPAEIERGEFKALHGWMQKNVYQFGRKFDPQDLITRATGEPLQARSYMNYLKTKYSDIYGLK